MHSLISHDSRLSLDEIAAAAKNAGLDFVVLTDHNAQYGRDMSRDGVTLIAATELSTAFGHLLALDLKELPDREEIDEPEVMEDVAALQGLPIVAHPTDAKRPWTGTWDKAFGLEIANVSSAARALGGLGFAGLVPVFLVYGWNPDLALAQLYKRDDDALALWDQHPNLVAFCGADAHGWIDPARNLLAWTLVLQDTHARDAASIRASLRAGRFACSAGLLGAPPQVTLSTSEQSVVLSVDGSTANSRELVLLRSGIEVARSQGTSLQLKDAPPGHYRAELRVRLPGLFVGTRETPIYYTQYITVP